MTAALNGKPLTTHEATIQTAQVEIQVLRVGKKQVTMGMFRQLPLATLVDTTTLHLQGVPWGYVRYWWDGDGREDAQSPTHALHLVWQAGDRLCRGIVTKKPPDAIQEAWTARQSKLMTDIFVLRLPHTDEVACFEFSDPYHFGVTAHEVWIDGLTLTIRLDREARDAINLYCRHRDGDPQVQPPGPRRTAVVQSRDQALRQFGAVVAKRGLAQGRALLASRELQLRELQASMDDYRERWATHWKTLSDLPQLFIAV
jgi:hypothetical protein